MPVPIENEVHCLNNDDFNCLLIIVPFCFQQYARQRQILDARTWRYSE